ncbi:cytochrome P450 family protein [Micromonospora sp. CB01531]|uniref:cytochrome P450 family protein n=1 Tax=Micromonospora sp. CB01531 TaxID=1718947 RepID=UPI00093CBD7C|nr:cytochrome P450 [Micromonospora sp. CB01531]
MDHRGDSIALNDVLTDPDTRTDLQKQGPVHRATLPNGMPVWLVVGYDEAVAALNDDNLSTALATGGLDGGALSPDMRDALLKSLTNSDQPDHTRLRRLVSKAFTARRVEAMRPWISRLTDELIDGFAQHDQVDLMAEFAAPLPILVITELLGIPEADRPQVRAWSRTIISRLGMPDFPVRAATEFVEYLRDLIAQRRDDPDEGLISALIRARDENDALSANELTATIFLMIVAGHDTTLSLIGNGVYLLMQKPDRAAQLRADPSLLPAAIEEFLRLESPVPVANFRAAVNSFDIGGTRISAGDLVVISLQAANRNDSQFSDPSRFDLARTKGRHLAFGHGIHFCLGAPLARLEGELAIGTLLKRFPDLRLAVPAAELTWSQAPFIHRLDKLPLLLS